MGYSLLVWMFSAPNPEGKRLFPAPPLDRTIQEQKHNSNIPNIPNIPFPWIQHCWSLLDFTLPHSQDFPQHQINPSALPTRAQLAREGRGWKNRTPLPEQRISSCLERFPWWNLSHYSVRKAARWDLPTFASADDPGPHAKWDFWQWLRNRWKWQILLPTWNPLIPLLFPWLRDLLRPQDRVFNRE